MRVFLLLIVTTLLACNTTKKVANVSPPKTNEGYLFEFTHKPSTVLKSETKITMINETIFEGLGENAPMVNEMTTIMSTTTKYSEFVDGQIPVTITYDEFELITDPMPGNQFDMPDFTNVNVYGFVKNNKISLDSVTNVEEPFKTQLKQGLLSAFKNSTIDFPDKKIMIADSFTTHQPLDIPLPEGSTNDVILTTTYILSEVKGQDAFFNLSYSASGNISVSGIKAPIESLGTGTMIYIMDEGYVRSNVVEDVSHTSMEMNGMKMKTKIKTSTKVKNTKL